MTMLSSTDAKANIDLVKKLSNAAYPGQPLLAALSATQAILEGGLQHAPASKLAAAYNNLFGIKGIGTGMVIDGKMKSTVTLPTHEYFVGQGMIEVDQRFAVNDSVEASIDQHKHLLGLPRYAKLKQAESFEEIAQAVHDAGYATDPKYVWELVSTYNQYIK